MRSNLLSVLEKCDTDAFLVMHKGILKYEFFDNFTKENTPHIIFSLSKSITSLLVGILVSKKVINLESPVSTIIEETRGSAYEHATVRNVLDMNVASKFVEDYAGNAQIFKDYRASTGWDIPKQTTELNFLGLHDFLSKLPTSDLEHGRKYHYCSPHSDLLGWIIERASGKKYSKIMSELLFEPAGTIHQSYVTVDKWGASRAAGGISISPYDLLIISELVRCYGKKNNDEIIPSSWIEDIQSHKNNKCYLNQDNLERFPNGNYRSKWYQTGFNDNEFCGIGIHGQNIWINPNKELTIIRMSSAADPINIKTEELMFEVFEEIGKTLS
jgi:CubicO group peptidase (beta-lactamase class C family)